MFGQHVASSDLLFNSDAPEAKLLQAAISSPMKGELETKDAHQYITAMDSFLEYEYAYYKATQPSHLEYHNKLQKASPATKLHLNHPWSLNIVDPSSPQCPQVKQKRYEEIVANKLAKHTNEDKRTYNELATLLRANEELTNMPGLTLLSDILREITDHELPKNDIIKKPEHKLPSWDLLMASCDSTELRLLNGLNLVQHVLSLLEPDLRVSLGSPICISTKTSTESPIKLSKKEEESKPQKLQNNIQSIEPNEILAEPFIETYKNISLLSYVTSSSDPNSLPNLQVFCQWFGDPDATLSTATDITTYIPTYKNISLLSQVSQINQNDLPNLETFCKWFSPQNETAEEPTSEPEPTNDEYTTTNTEAYKNISLLSCVTSSSDPNSLPNLQMFCQWFGDPSIQISEPPAPSSTSPPSPTTPVGNPTLPTLNILLSEYGSQFSGLERFNQLLSMKPGKGAHKLAISKLIESAPLDFCSPCLNNLLIAYNKDVLSAPPSPPLPTTTTTTTTTGENEPTSTAQNIDLYNKPIPIPQTNYSPPKPNLPSTEVLSNKILDIESEPPPLPPPSNTTKETKAKNKAMNYTSELLGNTTIPPPIQEEKPNRRLFFDENTPENLLLKSTLLQPLKLDNYEETQEELDHMQSMDSFLEYEYVYYKAIQKSRNSPIHSPSPRHPVKPKAPSTTTPTVNSIRLHHPWSLNSPFVEKKRKEIRMASKYSTSL